MGIRLEKNYPIITIILDNPKVKNAVDRYTASALAKAFLDFELDESLSVAVLWGDHGCFCSGANIKKINTIHGNRLEKTGDGPMGPTRMRLTKPVIAAISGYAVGGGLELALWCDLRIVEEDAILGVFNRRWGIPLIDGGTVRLPRLIGLSNALDMILTGRPINAEEALRMGLANRITPIGRSKLDAEELALKISRFPQRCLREDRQSVYDQFNLNLEDAMKLEFEHGLKSLEDVKEGIKTFLNCKGRHDE